jgi:hypothetical protein
MPAILKTRCSLVLGVFLALTLFGAQAARSQDDPNEAPLGDVARNLRNKTPQGHDTRGQIVNDQAINAQEVIDNDNLPEVMRQAESQRKESSSLKFLMAGDSRIFRVSTPDATCSLSFSAAAKSLLSNQYDQMDLPPNELMKLAGPATIEGDALTVSVFNGTDWHVSEVSVALTVVKKAELRDASLSASAPLVPAVVSGSSGLSEVRPEKKPDVTVIYRMRAAAPPSTTTVFSTPLNLELAPGEEWHWALVQARGYPPPSYSPVSSQAATQVNPPVSGHPTQSQPSMPQNAPAHAVPQASQ